MDLPEWYEAEQTIKIRTADNAWSYTDRAFLGMVDQWLYEEDVKRGLGTGRLVGVVENGKRGPLFVVQGVGMRDEPVEIVCRLLKDRMKVEGVFRR